MGICSCFFSARREAAPAAAGLARPTDAARVTACCDRRRRRPLPLRAAGRTRVHLKTTGETFTLVPPTTKANNVILGGCCSYAAWVVGVGWAGVSAAACVRCAARGTADCMVRRLSPLRLHTRSVPSLPPSLPPTHTCIHPLPPPLSPPSPVHPTCTQARPGSTPTATTRFCAPPPAPRPTSTSSPAAGLGRGGTRCVVAIRRFRRGHHCVGGA